MSDRKSYEVVSMSSDDIGKMGIPYLCMPVAWGKPFVKSERRPCLQCEQPVWCSIKATVPLLDKYKQQVLCLECATKTVNADGPSNVTMDTTVVALLHAHGGMKFVEPK